LLPIAFLACATAAPTPAPVGTEEVKLETAADVECLRKGEGGKTMVNPACIRQDVGIAPDVTFKTLGNVAVATFVMSSTVHDTATNKMMTNSHPDTSGATDAFVRRMLGKGINMVERERALTDKMLEELKYSTDSLIEVTSAPKIGHHLGAKTLIVGKYEFSGDFDVARDEKGGLVIREVKKVSYQMLKIKGLDLEKGRVAFDMKFSLTEKSSPVLMPEKLAGFAANVLIDGVAKNETVSQTQGR
jgi:hypothetical protein